MNSLKIEGHINKILYSRDSGSYKIAEFTLIEDICIDELNFKSGDIVKIKGRVPFDFKSIDISLYGHWQCSEKENFFFVSKVEVPEERKLDKIKKAIMSLLKDNLELGNTCVDEGSTTERLKSCFSVDESLVTKAYEELAREEKILSVFEFSSPYIYKREAYDTECDVVKNIGRILEKPITSSLNGSRLDAIENRLGIKFSKEQKKAISLPLENKITVITGGPGTGKTTVINGISSILKDNNLAVAVAAPTGRAAKRINDSTSIEAVTIHRLLEAKVDEETNKFTYGRDKEHQLEYDAIIIDEASMVDINLMKILLDAVKDETILILVGDYDQLPSVGPGDVLRDIIESEVIKGIRLTAIYRQEDESGIIKLANDINKGERCDLLSDRYADVNYVELSEDQEVIDEIIKIASNRNVQVLTPQKREIIGTVNLNKALQNKINPLNDYDSSINANGYSFRQRDRVMQMKNNYMRDWEEYGTTRCGKGVYNGDMGTIESVDSFNNKIVVEFDDGKKSTYEFNELEEISLAYAITVHKSQGTEFDSVVLPMCKSIFKPLKTRNLIYTAVTRARKNVHIIGCEDVFNEMAKNNTNGERVTTLKERIIKELKN